MRLDDRTIFNRIAKVLAIHLSRLLEITALFRLARLLEAYLCVLQGKGAGTGWASAAEARVAKAYLLSPEPVVFDVGAREGRWATDVHEVAPRARIFMFEPQPSCQEILEKAKIPGAVLIPLAASSVAGQTVILHATADPSGISSLHRRRESYFSDRAFTPMEVRTTTIDAIVKEHGLAHIDLMKVDVEGHDLEVLKGAIECLKSGRIRALTFEFGSGQINSRTFFHDFWDLLVPLGYKIHRILPSGGMVRIPEYYEDCEYFRGVSNYVAVFDPAR